MAGTEQGTEQWLDVPRLAEVRAASADELFPLANLFAPMPTRGWRAADPGPQIIHLRFHQPQAIGRIQIHGIDRSSERTQTLVLRAKSVSDAAPREFARLTFEFQPSGSTEEFEDLRLELDDVEELELDIDPGLPGTGQDRGNYATLTSLRIAAA